MAFYCISYRALKKNEKGDGRPSSVEAAPRPPTKKGKGALWPQFVEFAHLGNDEVDAAPAELCPLLPIPPQPRGVQRTLVGVRHGPLVLAEVAHPLQGSIPKWQARSASARVR